jgi:hypothetical protein
VKGAGGTDADMLGSFQSWIISILDHFNLGSFQSWIISILDHFNLESVQSWFGLTSLKLGERGEQ